MSTELQKITKREAIIGGIFLILLAGVVYFGEFRRNTLARELSEAKGKIENIENKTVSVDENLNSLNTELVSLVDVLKNEQDKSDALSEHLGKVRDTIGTLDALSKTDPELLQKYSKVFFLNEHYVPKELTKISSDFIRDKGRTIEIHGQVWPYLEKLLKASKEDDLELFVQSGYRSFGTQASLKSTYKVIYGAGTANSFSADQGYSEHQLGTTIDFTTNSLSGELTGFEKTKESDWLIENAYKYGFVLSYPESNKYYIYEPWHWRFVGVDLAERLNRNEKYFYDLDQREIDSYLSVIFN